LEQIGILLLRSSKLKLVMSWHQMEALRDTFQEAILLGTIYQFSESTLYYRISKVTYSKEFQQLILFFVELIEEVWRFQNHLILHYLPWSKRYSETWYLDEWSFFHGHDVQLDKFVWTNLRSVTKERLLLCFSFTWSYGWGRLHRHSSWQYWDSHLNWWIRNEILRYIDGSEIEEYVLIWQLLWFHHQSYLWLRFVLRRITHCVQDHELDSTFRRFLSLRHLFFGNFRATFLNLRLTINYNAHIGYLSITVI
jgi:hypothetical protein